MRDSRIFVGTNGRWALTATVFATVFLAIAAGAATAQQDDPTQPRPSGAGGSTAPHEPAPHAPAATKTPAAPDGERVAPPLEGDWGYYDEPPLNYHQRQWRQYTRHTRPQRFARRDLRRNYGYDPPFYPGYNYGRYGHPYGYDDGYVVPRRLYEGEAYIQGRHDERRFRDWKEGHDKNKSAYANAMSEGVRLFRETDYAMSLQAFVRAAKLNQGDPASRLHATYALVALGNYDDAVLMVRRAIQLQSMIPDLPLSIRGEYGPPVDFDAHLTRLEKAATEKKDDPGLWMLLGIYQYFSDAAPSAYQAFVKASELAPQDPIIQNLKESARLLTPSTAKQAEPH